MVGVVGQFSILCRGCRESEKTGLVEGLWKGSPQRVRAPYTKTRVLPSVFPSSTEPVEFGVNLAGPPAKPKYFLVTDSGQVP